MAAPPDEPPRRRPNRWPALATEILLTVVIATTVWWFMRGYRECRERDLGWFYCVITPG